MAQVSIQKKGKFATTQVTSRTTHLSTPDKYTKDKLIQEFRTKGYLLPMDVTKKALYRAALGKEHGVPMYIPLVKDVVAPDYEINKHTYIIKPEVAAIAEYANMPGEAVAAIAEEVVFNVKGVPLWCEGSRVDLHYYLMLLQYLDPRIYLSLKSSTEVVQHVLLLDEDAKNYLNVQNKIGKKLLDLQSHAVKLRGMKNKTSDQMKTLLEIGTFCKSQVLNYVQTNGGLEALGNSFLDSMEKLVTIIGDLSATTNLSNARDYYRNYVKINRSGFRQHNLAIDINEKCPPPLQDTEMPVESFSELTSKMLGFLSQNDMHASPASLINSGMPSYGHRVPWGADNLDAQDTGKMSWLTKLARDHIKKNQPLSLVMLRKMLAEKIWKFDVETRCFVPTEGWENVPRIPANICYQFAASEEGSKMIEAALKSEQIRMFNPADYFGKTTAIDGTFINEDVGNSLINELTAPIIQSAATDREKTKMSRTINKVVLRAVESAVDKIQTDPLAIDGLLKKRRETILLAFPPLHRIQANVSQTLCDLADQILRENATFNARLQQMDPEKNVHVKIVEMVQPYANRLSKSPEFVHSLYQHAKLSYSMIESKRLLSSGELQLAYTKAAKLIDKIMKEHDAGNISAFIKEYDALSALGLNNNYEPSAQSVNSAQTAGANTAGATAVVNGFVAALDVNQHIFKMNSGLEKKDISELVAVIKAIPWEETPQIVQTLSAEMKQFYDQDIPSYVESLQPYSLAYLLFGRYLLDVCLEASVHLNSVKRHKKLPKPQFEKACEAVNQLYRCTLLCKYQHENRYNTDSLPLDFIRNCIVELAKHKIIQFKTTHVGSVQVNFQHCIPENDFFTAFAAIAAIALRSTGNKLKIDSLRPILASDIAITSINAIAGENTSSYDGGYVSAFLNRLIGKDCNLVYISEQLNLFNMAEYFDTVEVTLPFDAIESPMLSTINMKNSKASEKATVSLTSIFMQPKLIDAVRNTLWDAVVKSNFFKNTTSFWKKGG